MTIETPASITSLDDRIALNRDLLQETIIDELDNPLTEVFNVVILSGEPQGSANLNTATAYGNPTENKGSAGSPAYFFSRVRRLDVDSLEKPDPFMAKTFRLFRRLVNLHPLGATVSSGETTAPAQGDIWEARYLNKFRRGLILNKKVSRSQSYEALRVSDKSSDWLKGVLEANPQGSTVSDYVPALSTGGTEGYNPPLRRVYVGPNLSYKGKAVENGNIPAALLDKTNEGTKILKDLVPEWNKLESAYHNHFGFKLGRGGGIRSYKSQIATKKRWVAKGSGSYAAYPGTSNHGWGMAVDIKVRNASGAHVSGKPGFETVSYKWMMENAPKYGFHNPTWARKDNPRGPDEPWHWEPIKPKNYIKKSSEIKSGEH